MEPLVAIFGTERLGELCTSKRRPSRRPGRGGEHEGHESYLWVVSLRVGATGEAPAAGAVSGGGGGAMNEHGNLWNAMERGEHELQRVERSRF